MESNICMYADDHQLFEVHEDAKVDQSRLQDIAGIVTDCIVVRGSSLNMVVC